MSSTELCPRCPGGGLPCAYCGRRPFRQDDTNLDAAIEKIKERLRDPNASIKRSVANEPGFRERMEACCKERGVTLPDWWPQPCRSPYCECDVGKCTHPGFYDARGTQP